jgi:hypothetical protein
MFAIILFRGVRLSSLLWLLYQHRMMDECGAVGGMRTCRGNWNTRRKSAPLLLCPTWLDLEQNPGHRGAKSVTCRLSFCSLLPNRIWRTLHPLVVRFASPYATSRMIADSIPGEVIGFFNWPNPYNRTMALGSTQSLTEMSTRNLPGGKGRPVGALSWQLHRHLWFDCLGNVGASTSHNLMSLHGLLQGQLYLFYLSNIKICIKVFQYLNVNATSLTPKSTSPWNAMSCSLTEIYKRLGEKYCLHLQGRKSKRSKQPK